jgi:hypothetical protein
MKVYHQLGHNYKWNLKSILFDMSGDGLIVGPRYLPKKRAQKISSETGKVTLFDPQFYIPGTSRGHLATYDFYPDVLAEGFSTAGYEGEIAQEGAARCLAFQDAGNFDAMIVPTRYVEGSPSNFTQAQTELFVRPFIDNYVSSGYERPLLLQVIINDLMLKDDLWMAGLLNWATSFDEIQGIYLIFKRDIAQKQIVDVGVLLGMMRTVSALRKSGLEVIVGYVNIEALLLSLAGPTAVATGSYENLRMFSLRAFEDQDDRKQQGPTPRVYSPLLCQWIEYPYVDAMRQLGVAVEDIFGESSYRVEMFEPTFEWNFNKPQLYQHYFLVFLEQLHRLDHLDSRERCLAVMAILRAAMTAYEELSGSGLVFSPSSSGDHLPLWATVVNIFAKEECLL